MRRLWRVLLLGVTLGLSACGGPPSGDWPAGAPPRNLALMERPITLRVWMGADYVDQAPILDLVKDFEQAYPNIEVELAGHVWQEMAGKVRLAISQGAPPDVAHQHAFAMGARGMAEPVDDPWEQWGTADQFMPGAIDDVTWQGRKYGVPLDINTLFMIYNKAAFLEGGLALPGPDYTYAQLGADLERLTTPDHGRYGIALSASGWRMYGLLASNGGELLHEENGQVRVSLNDPKVVETLRFFNDLGRRQLGTLPPPQPRQSDHPVALFGARKVALFFTGPSDLVRLKNEAPPEVYAEVGTAPLPLAEPGAPSASALGGGSLFVPKGAEHRVAAFEFMKWAVADKYALRMAKEMGRYPVRSALYEDPFFKSEPLLFPFLEQLKTARPYKLEAYPTANDIWIEVVRELSTPGGDVDVLINVAQKEVQQAVAAEE